MFLIGPILFIKKNQINVRITFIVLMTYPATFTVIQTSNRWDQQERDYENIRQHYLGYIWRTAHSIGVFHCRIGPDDNYYWHSVWITKHKTWYAGYLAFWQWGKMERITTRVSEYFHEYSMVFRGRHLDLAYSYLLWFDILYHHHRHPFRKDAFSTS